MLYKNAIEIDKIIEQLSNNKQLNQCGWQRAKIFLTIQNRDNGFIWIAMRSNMKACPK